MLKSVQTSYSSSVQANIFPLKERVRGNIKSIIGELEMQHQQYAVALQQLNSDAVYLRQSFGVHKFDGGIGSVQLEIWHGSQEIYAFPQIRWIWRWAKFNNGRKTGILLPLMDVINESKLNNDLLSAFFALIHQTLHEEVLNIEIQRTHHNYRGRAIRANLLYLDQIRKAIQHSQSAVAEIRT